MRKTETRWISRDMDGCYAMWKKKPSYSEFAYWQRVKNSFIQGSSGQFSPLCINLVCGGLAKITIERLY